MSVKKLTQNKYRILLTVLGILLAVLIFQPMELSLADKGGNSGGGNSSTEITACATQSPKSYTQFVESDFNLINVTVDPTTKFLALNTGNQAIDTNNIVVPFDQEVSVTFIFEGGGYTKTDFGWFFAKDVVKNADGTANFTTMNTNGVIHEIYYDVNDNNSNGILDVSGSSTADRYGDTNGDGKLDVWDNTVSLGKFTGGTELIFYLKVDDQQLCGNKSCVYYTKTAWNPDFYDTCRDNTGKTSYERTYNLGVKGGEEFNTSSGWMTQAAIDRLKTYFGVTLEGSRTITYTRGVKHSHVIVGAPPNDPNQWILGWDDQAGGTPAYRAGEKLCGSGTPKTTCTQSNCDSQTYRSDMDMNDLVFRVNRKTGGTAALTASEAIKPSDLAAYFTGVTFEVYDDMPCAGKTSITYSVSPDNGITWTDILDWDEVYVSDTSKSKGAAVTNWSPGKPEYTLRRATIDFLSSGKVGQAFLWKASMFSESEQCVPRIMGVNLGFSIAKHGIFARSAPVTMVNMLYSGNYETPDPLNASWTDMTLRGHLTYTRLYQPDNPTKTDIQKVLDAGEVLSAKSVSSRKIYYPDVTVIEVSETIGKGDSPDGTNGTKKFSGKISYQPMQDGSLVITDGTEKFTEDVEDALKGSFEGSGSIDRFTGEFTVTFKNPPWVNVPVTATYRYYKLASGLKSFATGAGVTPALLGLTSDWSYNASGAKVYTDDFNKDGKMDQNDANWLVNWTRGYKDGVNNQKSWLLGAIDHSTPAIDVPPGRPAWYYGTLTTKEERDVYKAFADANADRRATVYVGSRDGMLHAFDAGMFRWGNNPKTTTITENTGYFEWSGDTPSDKDDYGSAEERWAFIPINLMSRLKNNYKGASKQSYVDASPTVADVYINNKWVSILMTAEGNGGDTVVCLDVTDPNNPKFLWEYANTELYKSKSSPSVARLGKIKTGGESKWVAFFVSAKSNPAKYPAIYVVDIATGALLKKVYLYAAELGTTGLGGIPSGQPAVVDFDGDGYADRLYIGANSNLDQGIGNGYLYKVNISGDDNWQICILNSSISNPLPIFGTPVAIVDRGYDEDGNPVQGVRIFYGTGDSPYKDDDVSASTVFSFYGFEDNDSNATCTPITEGPSFQKDFDPGEKVWTSAFASAGQIYFGTTTADTEDPCDGYGKSTSATANVYVLGKSESGEMKLVHTISDTSNNNIPPVVDDGHLYIRGPDGKIKSYGSGTYNNAKNIYGIAQPPKQKTWREVYKVDD